MAFNQEERHAALGAGIAAGVPVAFNAVGVESLIVDLADAVFEGDRTRAAQFTAAGFALSGLALIGTAVFGGGIDGVPGIVAISLGMTLLGLAVESIMEA